jgi:hypothetical protein
VHGPSAQLAELQHAYRDLGGVLGGDDLSLLLRGHCAQPISLLARWIVDGRVLSIDVGGQRWLPMFQFDPQTLQARRGIEQVIGELRGAYDEAELVQWFATPSTWLADARPAEVIAGDPAAVVAAARADRFVALG